VWRERSTPPANGQIADDERRAWSRERHSPRGPLDGLREAR
jgi:hypothetical protein